MIEVLSNPTIIVWVSVATVVLLALLGVLLQITSNRLRDRYNETLHRVELSEIRASVEAQLAKLTKELTATEGRWNEVNHLVVSGQNSQVETTGEVRLTRFLADMGVRESDLELDPTLVFVLTPFGSEEFETYDTVRNVCLRSGLKCARGDEEFARAEILPNILRQIARARVVVANIGTRNPNVFYELGIAHSMGKPTILISQTIADVPFDVKHRQVLVYRDQQELDRDLTASLLRVVTGSLQN